MPNKNFTISIILYLYLASIVNIQAQLVYNDADAYATNRDFLQNLFDNNSTISLDNPGGNSVLYIDKVLITNDIEIIGNGLTIKRTPNIWQDLNNNTDDFNRVIDATGALADSIIIKDLIVDGSILEMAALGLAYENYEIEQAALLFVSRPNNLEGRLNVIIDNCQFNNNGADGIHVFTNVNFSMFNSSASDCFRGGLTCTGGNSVIGVNGFSTYGPSIPTGIDIEVDGAATNDNFQILALLNNFTLDSDLDISVVDNSVVAVSNLLLEKPNFAINGRDSRIQFTNSTFHHGYSNDDRILWPKDIRFKNCTFIASCFSDDAPRTQGDVMITAFPKIVYSTAGDEVLEGKVLFDNCNFKSDCNDDTLIKKGVVNERFPNYSDVKIKFNNCTFEESLDVGVSTFTANGPRGEMGGSILCTQEGEESWISAGCNFTMNNCINNADLGLWIKGTNAYSAQIEIRNTIFNNQKGFLFVESNGSANTNDIHLECVQIQGSNNIYAKNFNASNESVNGIKTIHSNPTIPEEIDGQKGDILVLGSDYYYCENPGFHQTNELVLPCEDINENDYNRSLPTWIYLGDQEDINVSASCFVEYDNCHNLDLYGIVNQDEKTIELIFDDANCGITNYEIEWDHGATTARIESLEPNTYCVSIKSIPQSSSCESCYLRRCFTIEGSNCSTFVESLNHSIIHPTCGTSNGSIAVDPYFAETCYNINSNWSNGMQGSSVNNLSSGEYCITIVSEDCTDPTGNPCKYVRCFNILNENQFCEIDYCISDIDSEFSDPVLNFENAFANIEYGIIEVEFSCETTNQIWKYNNTVLNNFDPNNIEYPGQYCIEYTDLSGCKGEHCFLIGYCPATEPCRSCDTIVTNNNNNFISSQKTKKLDIYPNPFSETLHIESEREILDFQIRDLNGQVIKSNVVYDDSGDISISELNDGVYYLTLRFKENPYESFRIVKIE